MKVRIVANPVSGGGRGKSMAQNLQALLADALGDVELVLTQKAGDAGVEAGRPGAECIVAVGGDGTINEIANGLRDAAVTLAILPMGTANVVARELGIPRDPRAVAAMIVAHHLRKMDVGVANGKRFLLGAGAGIDAAVAQRVSERRGKSSNYLKWVGPTLSTVFTYTYPEIRVVVDGKEVSGTAQYAIVGNCRYSAGVFVATPKAKIDDGLLDVCLMHNLNPLRLAALVLQLRHGRFLERDDVIYVQGKHVELTPASEDPVPLQIDGDPAGYIPSEFTVVPEAIQMVVPR